MDTSAFEPPAGWHAVSGEMAALFERTDWSQTALGSAAGWSPSLKRAVDLILAAAFPMALRWGNEFVLLYNDAYRPILGDKHPRALGQPAREAWSEVWKQIEPAHIAILEGRSGAIFTEDVLLRIQRHGANWDDAHFTLGYSPIADPTSATGVGGVFVTAVETTNRVAAQKALEASEERYALALGAAGVIGTWDWDIRKDRFFANAKFAELHSVDPIKAAAGAPFADFMAGIHPDDRASVGAQIARTIAGRSDFSSEHRLLRRDGSTLWMFARGGVTADAQGKVIRLAGAAVDITERKMAEAELSRSETEFRTLSQAVPNHVWVSRPNGELEWFNERVYEYSGAAQGSLYGAGWLELVHPEDRASAGERWAAALQSGETYQTDFRLRRADGQYRWHIARALPIKNQHGEVERWIGTNTDIEEERRAAAALGHLNATLEQRVAEQAAERNRLWQTSRDLLVVVGADGTISAANPAWMTLLGWRPEEVIGKNHLEMAYPEDAQRNEAALHEAMGAPLSPLETRQLHKDGSYRWISWVAAAEGGRVYASGRDVSAQKDADNRLLQAQEALRQSQKMEAVGQLTGGIAHDFNNMLAVVMGSLELLRRLPAIDPRATRFVEAGIDAGRRAAQLTQRLLAFSRQQPLKPEPIDANKLVAGMSDLLRHSIGADIRLETVLAGGLWRTFADPNQLENIIVNLALNSRDAMPEGGRLTIETQNAHLDDRYVTLHPEVSAGQYVLIAVSDTGSGMLPQVMEKAFDPFFTTKPVGKGTGLGLSQAYGFIKQSGGHTKIYSEVGHGTTVKIYLPRLTGAALRETLAPDRHATLPQGRQGEIVLVVEDEPAVREFSVAALQELGYPVLEADSALAALRVLEAHPEIRLLFTDIVMPEINGAKLAAEVRRRRADIRILFTTGYTRNAIVHNGVLDAGVEMIGKPFTLEALAAKLRLVLDKPSGND